MKKLPTAGFELLFLLLLKLPQPDRGLGGITQFGIEFVASEAFTLFMTLLTFVTFIFKLMLGSCFNFGSCDD
jgi:hypothetical protein